MIVYDVTISCTVIVLKHVHVIKMIIIIGTPSNILADISVDISFILTRVSVKQFEILICIFQRHLDLLLIQGSVSSKILGYILEMCFVGLEPQDIYCDIKYQYM